MQPSAPEYQTTASPWRPRIPEILRQVEARKNVWFTLGPEQGTWPDNVTPEPSWRSSRKEAEGCQTRTDFGPIRQPATLERLGNALQKNDAIGVARAFERQRSFCDAKPGNTALWEKEVRIKMGELARLPANWDSYGASRVNPECLQYAIQEVLKACMHAATPGPSVVPTNKGGVMLEWHRGKIDLEVRVEKPGEATVFYSDEQTSEEEEFDLNRSIDRLEGLLCRLTERG